MATVRVLVSVCSHGGARENFVSILDLVTPCGLLLRPTARGSWRMLALGSGAGFGNRGDDQRPCIIQRELSAAPVLLE